MHLARSLAGSRSSPPAKHSRGFHLPAPLDLHPQPGVECETRLELHPDLAAWTWRIQLRNDSSRPISFDILQAQDLGLADEGAVRNNEAYTSQYLDLNPQHDDLLGWTILARQNQAQAHGRFPWLAVGCVQKAAPSAPTASNSMATIIDSPMSRRPLAHCRFRPSGFNTSSPSPVCRAIWSNSLPAPPPKSALLRASLKITRRRHPPRI